MSSNEFFDSAVTDAAADLEPVVETPESPFLYGTDLYLKNDISSTARSTVGREVLAQDLYHRTVTSPGQVPDDPDFGYNLAEQLSLPIDDLDSVAAQLQGELSQDDRVQRVETTISEIPGSGSSGRYSVENVIYPVSNEEPFQLVFTFDEYLAEL